MAVYFKGRKKRTGVAERIPVVRREGKRAYGRIGETGYWGVTSTKLRAMEHCVMYPLRAAVKRKIKNGEKPVVVDWGCGKGVSISELARENPDAKCYGFGDIFYSNWLRIKSARFIHGTAEDFFRYFKDGSIDILYSGSAIHYLNKKVLGYINRLIPKLKPNGVLALDLSPGQVETVNSAMQNNPDIETLIHFTAITIIRKK